jgi:hypothetical protein
MIGLGPDDEGVALRAAMLHTIGPRTTTIIEMAVHLVEKHQLGKEHTGAVITALAIEHLIFERE